MQLFEESIDIDGNKLTLQGGKLAKQATSAMFARMGDTCVLVTVTAGKEKPELDYFPLQVEYSEKLYAGGRIKGSRWVKREGRPSDDAVLKARLIDRSIRPLFPSSYRREVQIIITLLSVDGINAPEILSAIATSAALHLSSIPWNGPISTLRVGYVKNAQGEDTFFVSPTEEERKFSHLDLIVSSTSDKVNMIETEGEEIPEDVILKAISLAKKENAKIIGFIESLRKKAGSPKEPTPEDLIDKKLLNILKKDFKKEIDRLLEEKAQKEFDNGDSLNTLVTQILEVLKEEEYDRKAVMKAIDYLTKQALREKILKTKKRADGRGPDEIRPLKSEVSILPRTHGSAIFQRGDTQVLSIVTLGAPSLEQLIESPEGEEAKRYIHHYYMPPYSVGETGRVGFPSRREIGHGALAEKAIEPVLPSDKEFPYTIRVVSEVLSSNGSTSMASTCGSTLALMDAGVPIKAPVAGIAMGLISDGKEYVILTDIMGIEDFSGDMDFKVTGTENGITAVQLDVKIDGLTDSMISEVLEKAKKARLFILDSMKAAIKTPRTELSRYAPKVVVLNPPADKIGEIIGPGGRNIRNLIARTETEINVSDDGQVTITGINKEKVEEARKHIENITREVQSGEEFDGEVKRILPFGAFVELFPGKEGMVHVSKMAKRFVKDPNEIVKIGQKVKVKVIEIDKMGRINLQLISTL